MKYRYGSIHHVSPICQHYIKRVKFCLQISFASRSPQWKQCTTAHSNMQLKDCTEQRNNVIIGRGLYWMFKQAKKAYLFRWVQLLPAGSILHSAVRGQVWLGQLMEVRGWCSCWLTTAPPNKSVNFAICQLTSCFRYLRLPATPWVLPETVAAQQWLYTPY